jgi:dienelactone hydrolase
MASSSTCRRHLGESGETPRQLVRLKEQLADWQAAITFAASLPDIDPRKLAIWGFSASGRPRVRRRRIQIHSWPQPLRTRR